MISVDQALAQLTADASPLCDTETLALSQALGRTLAEPLASPIDVPPADNSAMDGYAVRAADIDPQFSYAVSQRIAAGTDPAPLQAGTAARIFTGGHIPPGADAVIIQEEARTEGDQVRFGRQPGTGDNIRRCGQDVPRNSEILSTGTTLRPQEVGLIASCGIGQVPVYKRLRVAILSTGDELAEPGEVARPGQIYNSNRYLLHSFCRAAGFAPLDFNRVPDSLEATLDALRQAAASADVILTTGGVSVGEEDHIKPAIEQLGQLSMWKVAIKPGKPLALGKVGNCDILGLPGNPASVFTTFLVLALPRLRRLQGQTAAQPLPEFLPASFSRRSGSRQEYLRARKTTGGVELFPNQSSGVLSSACWGDGFVVQRPGVQIDAGQPVEFLSYQNLLQP